jgi:hypothetical protein
MGTYSSFDWIVYLKNYPDLRQAGITDCEKAWSHYQRFGKQEGRICTPLTVVPKIKKEEFKYKVLYKNTDSYLIDFSNTTDFQLNGTVPTKMYSSTPCIVKVDESYILIVRYVNYLIKEYDPPFSYSLNKEIKLDKSFGKISEHFHKYSFKDDTLKHKGIEDIKLFNDSGKLYYMGNIFKFKKSCITSGLFDTTFNKDCILQTTFNGNGAWEKNWAFVKYQESLCVVYNWFPVRVCSIDYPGKKIKIIKEIPVPSLFENVRGSTNGYTFDDEIWFVTHINKNGDYYHLFVVFDLDMKLKRYSEHFKFEDQPVEFCLGLIMEPDRIILSYSINDRSSKLMIISKLNLKFHIV